MTSSPPPALPDTTTTRMTTTTMTTEATTTYSTESPTTVKIARPIPLTPGLHRAMLYFPPSSSSTSVSSSNQVGKYPFPGQHSGLLSHHGFTPPRVQYSAPQPAPPPPPPPPIHAGGPPSSIHLSPEVELTRVTPHPAAAVIILSEQPCIATHSQPRPMMPQLPCAASLPPPPPPPPPLLSTMTQAAAAPPPTVATSASGTVQISESQPQHPTRSRRQKPDDLVPQGCGLTREEIVCRPIDDFNDLVADKTEKEILVLKDRRRRGKNRVRFLLISISHYSILCA